MNQPFKNVAMRALAIRRPGLVGLTLGGALLAGCNATLEDGYQPKPLNATPDVRKSYYASPFTDSADQGRDKDRGPALTPGG